MKYGHAWETGDGEPHATVLADGAADFVQLIRELHQADTPFLREAAATIAAEANRSAGGRAALALLRDEGGPDLLVDVLQFAVDAPGYYITPHSGLGAALWTHETIGGQLVYRLNCGAWQPVTRDEADALLANHRSA